MNIGRVDTVLTFALSTAGQNDRGERRLGAIHLLKHVYLGDLAYAERHEGETFTGAPWRFHRFGPWCEEVFVRIQPVVGGLGAVEHRFQSSKAEGDFVRWELEEDDADRLFVRTENQLPDEVRRAVNHAVRTFGDDTKDLLHYVYRTRPMLRAAPGERLNFAVIGEPEAEMDAPLAPDHPVSAAVDVPVALSKRKRAAALQGLRERVRRALTEPRLPNPLPAPVPAPRYDEVFADGVSWLDALGRESTEGEAGTLHFSDTIWRSRGRRDPGIP